MQKLFAYLVCIIIFLTPVTAICIMAYLQNIQTPTQSQQNCYVACLFVTIISFLFLKRGLIEQNHSV